VDEFTGGLYKYTPDANQPPTAPAIDGPLNGKVGTSYEYGFISHDFEDDDIAEFIVNWGDNTPEETVTGPFSVGERATASHTWETEGTFTIQAKAKDVYGAESDWGTFTVTMPRNKAVYTSFFMQFLQNHPHLLPLLKQLIGL
jgi:hypothetical protein